MNGKPPTHPHENWYPDDYALCRLLKIYPDSLGAFMWQAGVRIDLGDWEAGHEDLASRFSAWADEYPDHPKDERKVVSSDPQWQDWKKRGFNLAQEVRVIVPEDYAIFYYPFSNEKFEIKRAG